MAFYKIQDNETGKTAIINWNKNTEPTEEDIAKEMQGRIAEGNQLVKPIYDQLSVKEHPILGTIQDVIGQGSGAFLNQVGANIPETLLRKFGKTLGEPVTPLGQVAETIGGVGGALIGAPVKAAKRLAMKIAPRAGWAMKGLLGGFGAGATYTPNTENNDIVALGDRLLQGTESAGLGLIGGVGLRTIRSTINVARPIPLMQKVRAGILVARDVAQEKFGNTLKFLSSAFPDRKVDLRPVIQEWDLKAQEENPDIWKKIKKIPYLQKLFDTREGASQVSVSEAQDMINKLSSQVAESKLASGGKLRPSELPYMEFMQDMRDAQLQAFPDELGKARADYSNFAEAYKTVRRFTGKTSLEPTIKKDWLTAEVKSDVNKLLPSNLINEMGGYKNAYLVLKWSPWILGVSGLAGGARYGIAQVVKGAIQK
jgi:hypothetical protein